MVNLAKIHLLSISRSNQASNLKAVGHGTDTPEPRTPKGLRKDRLSMVSWNDDAVVRAKLFYWLLLIPAATIHTSPVFRLELN